MEPATGRCEICGDLAQFHVTSVDAATADSESKSYCAEHLPPEERMFASEEMSEASLQESLANIRQVIEAMEKQRSDPAETERPAFGMPEPGSALFERQLSYLKEVADFVEKQGRFPNASDLGQSDRFVS